jgi:hypothetical protein
MVRAGGTPHQGPSSLLRPGLVPQPGRREGDRPTGSVVGQQPFGGSRASGTNDGAGSILDLQRWTSPRSIEETFVPATDHRHPHTD